MLYVQSRSVRVTGSHSESVDERASEGRSGGADHDKSSKGLGAVHDTSCG